VKTLKLSNNMVEFEFGKSKFTDRPINVLSCFDGISAGQVALERAGIKVANYYASEIDPYAIKITQKNYPNTIQLGDIENWESWDLPHIDLLIGGFPCQPYSISGKGLGIDDLRGQLIYPMLKLVEKHNPNDVMLENVPGLMAKKNKNVFEMILKNLNEFGYAVDWIIMDSALVSAQSRKRVYIIGKKFEYCEEEIYDYDTDEL
jgi:DNA-cytosine methyltransferase